MAPLFPINYKNESIQFSFWPRITQDIKLCKKLIFEFCRLIRPTEINLVSYATCGEGWHNYHHTFPWDYKAAEIGHLSLTTASIELFSKIGWAYDLKQATKNSVTSMILSKGDTNEDSNHAAEQY